MKSFKYILLFVIMFFASCAPKNEKSMSNGQVISSSQLLGKVGGGYVGDQHYAIVDSKCLGMLYDEFRAEIFKKGVVKWDERFDCNHFASYYVSLAQTKFYLANWGSATKANTLAIGTYWYVVGGKGSSTHAIVVIYTERGLIFIEPQTGKEVQLSESEKLSSYLKVF